MAHKCFICGQAKSGRPQVQIPSPMGLIWACEAHEGVERERQQYLARLQAEADKAAQVGS